MLDVNFFKLVPNCLMDSLRVSFARWEKIDREQIHSLTDQFDGFFHEVAKFRLARFIRAMPMVSTASSG